MDAAGHIRNERALDSRGKVLDRGMEYKRSSFLKLIPVKISPTSRVTWVVETRVHSGYLTFDQNSEDQVIRTCRTYGAFFEAHTLEKVNNDPDDCSFIPLETFYPALHRMLVEKRDWKSHLEFRGRASFEIGVMEWTESIMNEFKSTLENADIYGAVVVSRFPYHYSPNSWRAFIELWGPLTNTLHHGNGEMGITLRDLKLIGGLPILGVPYEEFIPVNEELCDSGQFPSTINDLLRIHSELCSFHKRDFVYWDQWLNHFYRGQLLYAAYGENRKRAPYPGKIACRLPASKFSREGKLAAFLSFWLSRFVLPCDRSRIRPETFYMACLMAQGVKISLAPTVLGYIYHGLQTAVTHPKGPGDSYACFPAHYVIGWIGEYFPCLYKSHADSELLKGLPHLARYAGIEAKELDISSARFVFRTDQFVNYRPSPFIENDGRFLCDDKNLTDEEFELLICTRSTLLPVRMGNNLWLEPYYPNRFARQFGFDQGVPSNKLHFGLAKRERCCIEDLAKAQHSLYQTDTGARFYVPRSTYNGICTWTYCRWWMRACAPYLGKSVSTVYLTLTKRPLERKDDIFVIGPIREFCSAPKEILFPKRGRLKAQFGESSPIGGTSENIELGNHQKTSRRRRKNHKISESTNLEAHTELPSDRDADRDYKRSRHEEYNNLGDDMDDNLGGDMVDGYLSPRDDGVAFHNSDEIIIPKLKSVIVRAPASNDPGPEPHPNDLKARPRESVAKGCDIERLSEAPVPATMVSEQQPEPKIRNFNHQIEDTHDSASGATEPIKSNASEHIDEDISSPTEATSTLHEIFGEGLNEHRRDFIIVEIQQILDKLSPSRSFGEILDCQDEVSKTLDVLELMFKTLGSGKDRFEWFAAKVYLTFDLAAQLSQDMSIVEKDYGLDIERINELIQNHKKCQAAKKALDSELLSLNQELESLKATERSIIEVEEKAQRLRKDYEIAKNHLEKKISWSEASLERQNKLDEELHQARIEAREDKLSEFKNVQSSFKVRQEELEKLIDTLKSFGQQLKQKC